MGQHVPKKNKVYCDKWVHEGVCAFAQQGCRYKHEMPLDRQTQHLLGLYHGLPAWWKKREAEHQAEMRRQRMPQESSLMSPTANSALAWSVPDTPPSQQWEAGVKMGDKPMGRITSPLSLEDPIQPIPC